MKKLVLAIALLCLLVPVKAQTKIAVMDFRPGVGVTEAEVNGLSDMLINALYESGKFYIVERSQLNQVLKEQDFQASELSLEQIAQVGRILGVKAVLVGTVNFLAQDKYANGTLIGEYNVDVRAVDVESGLVITTAGGNKKSNSTYRKLMQQIGKKLAKNLMTEEQPKVAPKERPVREKMLGFRESDWIITPYLYAGPNHFGWGGSRLFGGGGISVGYQINPHFSATLGISFDEGYPDYNDWRFYEVPNIDATFKYYPINHKNSFLLGITLTANKYRTYSIYDFCITPFVGFAFGNLETSVGYYYGVKYGGSLCLKLEYRLPVSDKPSSLFNKLKWW